MRLIDFDKLTETVKECSGSWTLPQQEGAELMLDIAEYLAEEKEDYAPVRHGKWLGYEPYGEVFSVVCSACGKRFYFETTKVSHEYCPKCGAKMDGGADDEIN